MTGCYDSAATAAHLRAGAIERIGLASFVSQVSERCQVRVTVCGREGQQPASACCPSVRQRPEMPVLAVFGQRADAGRAHPDATAAKRHDSPRAPS